MPLALDFFITPPTVSPLCLLAPLPFCCCSLPLSPSSLQLSTLSLLFAFIAFRCSFTGASRYRSSTSSVPMSSNQSGQSGDPFTGGSRYRPPTSVSTAPPVAPPVVAAKVTYTPVVRYSFIVAACLVSRLFFISMSDRALSFHVCGGG